MQPAASVLLQELREVKEEVSSTKEQLSGYVNSCSRLQEELNVRNTSFKLPYMRLKFPDTDLCISFRKRLLQ